MSDTALGAGMMEGGRKVVERMAGIKPLQFIKNNPGKVLGGGGLLTVLAAASELGDDDPVKQNLLQAAGRVIGSIGLGAAGTVLTGNPLVGLAAGGIGGELGSGAGTALYKLFNPEEEYNRDQRRKIDEDLREFANAERVAQLNNELSNAAMERQIQYEVARLANQQALNRQALTAQLLNQVGLLIQRLLISAVLLLTTQRALGLLDRWWV